jgi:hypothetical protein
MPTFDQLNLPLICHTPHQATEQATERNERARVRRGDKGKGEGEGGRQRERDDKVQQREQKGKYKRRKFEAEHMGWMMLGKQKRVKQVAVRLW